VDEWDAYFWPGSDVLRNIPGFTTNQELRRFEYAATRQRSEELALKPIPGHFDTAHFREIHRYLFQDVYEWAGEYRTVEFSKGSSGFAPLKTPTHTLETWGEKILGDLAAEHHLKELRKTAFVERLTHHYGELNFWHPMREGNGRATKEFLYQLAKQAGYELEFQRVGAKTWNTAAERQASGDDPRLALDVFNRITTPSRAIAFRDEHILDAVKRFPELQGAADSLAAAKRKSDAEYDAGTARLFLAKVQARLFERLSSGDIVQLRVADPPAKDAQDDYTRGR
jgi:cell filamentation protein, protein adenylyltransferase